jgi:hypothetical protein
MADDLIAVIHNRALDPLTLPLGNQMGVRESAPPAPWPAPEAEPRTAKIGRSRFRSGTVATIGENPPSDILLGDRPVALRVLPSGALLGQDTDSLRVDGARTTCFAARTEGAPTDPEGSTDRVNALATVSGGAANRQ